VHVFLDEDEECGFYIEEEIPGQSIGEVLAMTQYDWRDLEKRMHFASGERDYEQATVERNRLQSVRALLDRFPGDTIVHPGHGPATTLERELRTNPFLRDLRAEDS